MFRHGDGEQGSLFWYYLVTNSYSMKLAAKSFQAGLTGLTGLAGAGLTGLTGLTGIRRPPPANEGAGLTGLTGLTGVRRSVHPVGMQGRVWRFVERELAMLIHKAGNLSLNHLSGRERQLAVFSEPSNLCSAL
jgi:hypothetical protein